ncbi:hypothetical protein [Vibrio sp. 10N.261.55.A7]|uniref:hypothetical protein n=1 Tax=Vibrio sp. 10N.261.55.A7 TaxID=1880851 RepID=UPI0018E48184|nr:hypothetical protein [Vibrio sp. 10N.261.55.A7]
MELHNRVGEVARMADNLTLREVAEMGFTIDLCDEGYDPSEHWTMEVSSKGLNKDNRED